MARSGKDYFEMATKNIERTLKNEKQNSTVVEGGDFIKWKWELNQYVLYNKNHSTGINTFNTTCDRHPGQLRKFFDEKATFATVLSWVARVTDDEPIRTGMLNRDEWLKNKAIIEAKAKGDWVKPGKEPKEPKEPKEIKKPKDVKIISAFYGLESEKLIDITDKIKIGEKVNNELAGEDPCPRKKKEVIVKATVDGIEGDFKFIEGKKIVF